MSRSNPTENTRNPSTRWFEWQGDDAGGFPRWYDKDSKAQIPVPLPFTFILLDELSTVGGWHEPSESSIYANEVRDTRSEPLVVKSFKGGELASGLYRDIRDRVTAIGGHYTASLYIAYKVGAELKIGNLALKGAAAGAWMEFKRSAGTKKTEDGKVVPAYFVDAVKITGYDEGKKGKIVFRTPKFALQEISPETGRQATELDTELQGFLNEYLRRPKAAAATPPPTTQEDVDPDPFNGARAADFDDDIPFALNANMYNVGTSFDRRMRRARNGMR